MLQVEYLKQSFVRMAVESSEQWEIKRWTKSPQYSVVKQWNKIWIRLVCFCCRLYSASVDLSRSGRARSRTPKRASTRDFTRLAK